MDVYYNGNGYTWGKSSQAQKKLSEIPIKKTFFWGDQEIFLPALYVGQDGAVLDVCTKIPLEKMLLFLQKWNKKRRLSLRTPEEFEQMDAANPSSREFLADLCLDGKPLTYCTGSSLRWYPPAAFAASDTIEDWSNDPHAELLMTAYGCDRECCWHLGRLVYKWNDTPILSPQNLSLRFKAHPFSVTAGHFTTDASCQGRQIQTVHPLTGQEYTLTLYSCEPTRHDFTEIGTESMRYPEYCQILTYSVSPEIERSLLDIRDCEEGDQPRADSSYPTAVFMVWKDSAPGRRTAASSMHFTPVSETHWRIVFQVNDKEDLKLQFNLRQQNE